MEKKKNKKAIAAILWDFDGTIADTMAKNYSIFKKIYSLIYPNVKKENWPQALYSLDTYLKAEYDSLNWKDCYERHFEFSKDHIEKVKNLWADIASSDKTPIKIFEGIPDVLKTIKVPHGICSQNSSLSIRNLLKQNKIDQHFCCIMGNSDVKNQKPHPESFIQSVKNMNINEGNIFYVGDHKEDIIFAKNAEKSLSEIGYDLKILSIIACYSKADTKFWEIKPDFEAYNPKDIIDIVNNF